MNVHSDITSGRRAATPVPTKSELMNIHEQGRIALHLTIATTLLVRHLVTHKPSREGVYVVSVEHADVIDTLCNLAWSRSDELIEALEPFCEAGR